MKYYIKLLIKFFLGYCKLQPIMAATAFPILKSKYFAGLKSAKIFEKKEILWDFVINKFNQETLDFFEFGVHRGHSIKYFSERLKNVNNNFVGFDSFIGLPETHNHPSLEKGTFSREGEMPKIEDSRVKFVKGFFNEKKVEIVNELDKSKNIKLVHFDADLYSSTLFLLFALDDCAPYYAIFDEFGGDEVRALYSYLISTDRKVEIIATTYDDKLKIVPRETFMRII